MRAVVLVVAAVCLVSIAAPGAQQSAGKAGPTIGQFLGAASPIELVSAKRVDRIAWVAYDQGKRNVYTAAAPAFAPVRLTAYLKDDGVDLTELRISDDGSTVVFVRGSAAKSRRMECESFRRSGRRRGSAVGREDREPGRVLARRRGDEPGARARRQLGPVGERRTDLSREASGWIRRE